MISNLQDSVVLITSSDPNNTYFGTGFAIHCDEQGIYILTCAHIVDAVGGKDNVQVEGKAAEVVAIGSEADADLAVLRVKGLQNIPLLPLRLAGETGNAFTTAGFQSYNKKYKTCVGRSLQGTLSGQAILLATYSFVRIIAWDLKITGDYKLEEGYSGSPVEVNGNVIAVVSTRQGGGKGLAISVGALTNVNALNNEIWPEILSSLFLAAQSAKHQGTVAPSTPGSVPGIQANQLHPSRVRLASAPSVYRGHTSPVCKLAWSPDSTFVASVSREQTVRIWNDVTGILYQTYHGHREAVNTVAWSPDGTHIIFGDSNGSIYVWDTTAGEMRLSLRSYVRDAVNDVAWSPASRIAVAHASNIVQIYDAQVRDCMTSYTGHSPGIGSLNGVLKVAWSPDGTLVASSAWDKTVRVWDPTTGTTICTYQGHRDKIINDLSWSSDGKYIASAGKDATVQVWNARTGSTLLTCRMPLGQSVAGICWSPDGTCLASAGSDGSIYIWDATNGNTLLVHRITEGKALYAIAWSPNGQRLAVACANGDLQVWPISLNSEIMPG